MVPLLEISARDIALKEAVLHGVHPLDVAGLKNYVERNWRSFVQEAIADWSGRLDLNQRQLGSKPRTLPG